MASTGETVAAEPMVKVMQDPKQLTLSYVQVLPHLNAVVWSTR